MRRSSAGEGSAKVGAPFISGAKVVAELVEQTRGPKLIAFLGSSLRRPEHHRDRGRERALEVGAGERCGGVVRRCRRAARPRRR